MYPVRRLRRYTRIILFIVTIWIFFITFDILPGSQPLLYYPRRLFSRSRHSLHILKTAAWGQFNPVALRQDYRWLDLVGFRRKDGFAWDMLPKWEGRCTEFDDIQGTSYRTANGLKMNELEEEDWGDLTGALSGEWVRYADGFTGEKAKEQQKVGKIAPGSIDFTGDEGRVILRLEERLNQEIEVEQEEAVIEDSSMGMRIEKTGLGRESALVREISATLTIQDDSIENDGWEMRVHGVHWPRIGALLMTTTSEKFAGIFGLPHLSRRRDFFVTSQRVLSAMIERTLDETGRDSWLDASNPWTASLGAKANTTRPIPHYDYVVYVQLHPLKAFINGHSETQKAVSEMERELRQPNGTSVLRTSELQMSVAIFSPDCGLILESKRPYPVSHKDEEHLDKNEEEP